MTEYDDRLARLQAAMSRSGVDLVAIGPTANMHYLLGFAPHPDERLCLLLVTGHGAQVIVPDVNAEKVAANTSLPLCTWPDDAGPAAAIAQALGGKSIRRLAFDGAARADSLLPLMKVGTPEQIVPADELLGPMRMRKSGSEIDALQRAASQADRAMRAAVDACRLGVTEAEIAWETETAFRRDGADRVEFTLIASGPNGAFPHHEAGSRALQPGDAVIIDIGATLDGYQSDITRMVHMGEPSADFLRAYDAVRRANRAGTDAVRPGAIASEIDRVTRAVLEDAGYGEYFVHRTGHGIGREGHEPPWIMAGNDEPVEAGMAFSIEPGVYLQGRFGVRIEDIVAVTDDGVRTLTGFEKALTIR